MSDVSPNADEPRRSLPELLDRVLASPVMGFVPWILLSVLEGPGRLELAAGVALAISVLVILVDRLRGRSVKILGVVDVVSFAALLIIGLMLSDSARQWLETWFGEFSNIILVLVVAGSVVARTPFTLQYAREEVEPELWDNPVFVRINYVITAAWGVSFVIAAIAGFYGDAVLHNNSNLWTGWLIQIGAYVVAVSFTEWYPPYGTARAQRAAGQTPDEEPRPLASLFLPLATFLVTAGVLALTLTHDPAWVGIGLIVAGSAGAGWLRNRAGEGRDALSGEVAGT